MMQPIIAVYDPYYKYQFEKFSTSRTHPRTFDIEELKLMFGDKNHWEEAHKEKTNHGSQADTITPTEFQQILQELQGAHYVKQRKLIALLLLYLTGLRISDLLEFNVKNVKELLKTGETWIVPEDKEPYFVKLSPKANQLFSQFETDCDILSKNKQKNNPFFSSSRNITRTISREFFTSELNYVLKKAGNKLKKNLRTHSLRATVISELLQRLSTEEVKQIVGHKNIVSTLTYKPADAPKKDVYNQVKTRDAFFLNKLSF